MRRFIQLVLVMMLLFAGIGAWYLYRKGVTKSWREYVIEELHNHGVEVSFSRLVVDPFKGLVARDVRIFEGPERRQTIARVDEIIIEANLANAVEGKAFVDALTLTDANLVLLPDPKNAEGTALKIDHLNTRILLPPNQLFVSRFEAQVFGIYVNASGQLTNLNRLNHSGKAGSADKSLLTRLCKELNAINFPDQPTQLRVQFSGDLANPSSLLVQSHLKGGRVRWADYELESIDATLNWQNGALIIPRIEASDEKGFLQLSGCFDPARESLVLRMRSSLDLVALVQAVHAWPFPEQFRLEAPPEIELKATMGLGEKPEFQVTGHVELGRFNYARTQFESFNADFSWDGNQWAVRDVLLKQKRGELKGAAQQVEGDFRVGFHCTLNPEPLISLLPKPVAERLASLRFYDAPEITVSGRGDSPETMAASGTLRLGRTSYRGQEARKVDADLRFNHGVISIDHLELHRAEGSATGGLVFDTTRKLVTIDKIRMNLHPQEVALWIDVDLVKDVKPYRFGRRPPQILLNGIFDQRKPGLNTRLSVDVDAAGMEYSFCGKELQFDHVTGKLFFNDTTMKMTDTVARLFGGSVRADGEFSLLKTRPHVGMTLNLNEVDFSSLTNLYFDYNDSKGKLNAIYAFTVRGSEGRTMQGKGNLTVTNGNVFGIPFLGPFSDILNKIVPGMGVNVAQKASASFSIADGIITNTDLLIEGKGFSMIGDGRIWIFDDKMDFDIRINAQGLPGVLLFPVSKLFEYRADAKFTKPNWHPKVMPPVRRSPEN